METGRGTVFYGEKVSSSKWGDQKFTSHYDNSGATRFGERKRR